MHGVIANNVKRNDKQREPQYSSNVGSEIRHHTRPLAPGIKVHNKEDVEHNGGAQLGKDGMRVIGGGGGGVGRWSGRGGRWSGLEWGWFVLAERTGKANIRSTICSIGGGNMDGIWIAGTWLSGVGHRVNWCTGWTVEMLTDPFWSGGGGRGEVESGSTKGRHGGFRWG